jgi:predicted ATPase/class 3 adenylate cyclase
MASVEGALPTGTVTFLFTDLEVSTRLWEEHPEAMKRALARHDALLRNAVEAHGGHVVKTTGDGLHAAFGTAHDAVDAAVAAQRALAAESWAETGPLRARMGLHTGEAEYRAGDYYGGALNRAARLTNAAHGGQIVVSHATEQLLRDGLREDVDLIDLGEHRLRDLSRAERVFQVSFPGLTPEFAPLRSLDASAGNLPVEVTSFVGREQDLDRVTSALEHARVVTLTGAGGVGKTRLAVQAAAAALRRFSDGAWFVDLAPIDDESFVASEVAITMGLPERRQGSREEALVGALGRRHALVVLDNCEHLVDAVARVVDLVVRRCPGVTVLATSQEVLGIDGEATCAVRPLRGDEAERLFVERAEAARDGFELTAENAAALVELCRRLDGIPLAIELAAARVASMSPAAILARVDERFRLLGQRRRTARRSHQTLRAAVDWSYGLLESAEQLAFDRLSVFVGDFTIEAAEAIVADDDVDVFDVLAGLVAKSMVQVEEGDEGDRYRLLETMRDYGLEQLVARGDLERLQERHAAYYLDWAKIVAPHFFGRDDTAWLGRVEQEYLNIRAALGFTREHEPSDFALFVDALAAFWRIEGRYREGLTWITAAHGAAPDVPGRAAADALAMAGQMAINLARWDQGFDLIQQSLDRSASDGEPPRALALSTLAIAALVQNRPAAARRYSEEAVAVARARGEPFELAEALASAGVAISLTHDDPQGPDLADESVEVARSLGNDFVFSLALNAAGMTRYRTDPARAIVLLQAGLALHPTHDTSVAATSRFIMAIAHLTLGDDQSAAAAIVDALPRLQESGEEYYQAMVLAGAAVLLRRHGRPEAAARILALNEQLREDGRIVGAPRDLESQEHLKTRLEREIAPEVLAAIWAEGHAMTLDTAVAQTLDELKPIAESE